MKREEFVAETLAHYEIKLAEEKERFGVLAISDAPVEHHAYGQISKTSASRSNESLVYYDGPYKVEVPEDLFDDE